MNNYITLDGKKYKTTAKSWKPSVIIPNTIRFNLDGSLDATFGPATIYQFDGTIMAPVTAPTGYGSVDNLRASLQKRQILTFIDHYNTTYSIVSTNYTEYSLSPKWDNTTNEIGFAVQLIGKKG